VTSEKRNNKMPIEKLMRRFLPERGESSK
jgi:hypothetical protein